MTFAGLRATQQRADVIAYLNSLRKSEAAADAAQAPGAGRRQAPQGGRAAKVTAP